RGQETYGEDPFLTAQFGVAYVRALQGDDPHYFKVIATPKHYAVHSGPEPERHRFDAVVSTYDLYDTYLPAFQAAIQRGHAQSIMGAYSSLDGIPDNASPLLLQENLRQKWGFDGYVVSDCGAIGDIAYGHHYAKNLEEASADAVKAGCDLTCGGEYAALPKAVAQGLITEAQIDVSVKRLFRARMQLGMFDPADRVPYAQIPPSVIESQAHQDLALRAARESLVLLKNDKNMLPLHNIKTLAVIGPNADAVSVQRGNYNGTSAHEVSILSGLRQRAGSSIRIEYAQGSGLTTPTDVSDVPGEALSSAGKSGLRGEYFDNETLTGTPVAVRQDPQIDFNFSGHGPVPGLTQFHYSARWTGEITAPSDGTYTLGARGDDGFRLFVNGQKVVDDWGIHPAETKTVTLAMKAGQRAAIRLEYYQGEGEASIALLWQPPGRSTPFAAAVAAAKRADAVIFVGGISAQLEGEEGTNGNGDRADLNLPQVQEDLLRAVYGAGKPVVVVLMNGSALSVNWAQAHVPAILEAWYPGEAGGRAVADALFGDYNPAGRLPVTFYQGVEQLPPFRDYAMKSRTYRYFSGKPLYPFGYGLSYTQFRYSHLTLPRRVEGTQSVSVTAQVENIGLRPGDEVAELYLRPAPGGEAARQIALGQPMPRLELAGFARIPLGPGQKKTVTFTLAPEQLRLVNAQGARILQPGTWQVYIGGKPPDISAPKDVLSGMVSVQ
ncbi:MAG: glycoside hydrolase family 3 C-terminal domain-containing protein, partial [Armatimonadota bacterium]|nr:glycoside hydrolase family 3 C-terminal domain-containing protein [Armatimonadota bacterium]